MKSHISILRSDFFKPLTKKLDENELEETEFFIGALLAKFSSEHFKPNDIAVVQNLDPKYIFVVTEGEFVARTILSDQKSADFTGSGIIMGTKTQKDYHRSYTAGHKIQSENSRVPQNYGQLGEDGEDIRTSGAIVETFKPGNIFGHIPDQLDSLKEEFLSPYTVICTQRGTVAKISTEATREVFRSSQTGRLLCDALREERNAAGYRHPRQFGGRRVSTEERLRSLEAMNKKTLELLTALTEKKPIIVGRAISLPQFVIRILECKRFFFQTP